MLIILEYNISNSAKPLWLSGWWICCVCVCVPLLNSYPLCLLFFFFFILLSLYLYHFLSAQLPADLNKMHLTDHAHQQVMHMPPSQSGCSIASDSGSSSLSDIYQVGTSLLIVTYKFLIFVDCIKCWQTILISVIVPPLHTITLHRKNNVARPIYWQIPVSSTTTMQQHLLCGTDNGFPQFVLLQTCLSTCSISVNPPPSLLVILGISLIIVHQLSILSPSVLLAAGERSHARNEPNL